MREIMGADVEWQREVVDAARVMLRLQVHSRPPTAGLRTALQFGAASLPVPSCILYLDRLGQTLAHPAVLLSK